MIKTHVYVRSEYIDVAEGRISQTCNWTAVMQELSNFVPALSHDLKPLMRDDSQFTFMLFHPRVDGGIPPHSAVKSQQFRSHSRSTFCKGTHDLRAIDCDKGALYKFSPGPDRW